MASGVGLAIGIVAAVAGGLLFAHATDVRSRESSAADEEGLGALVGGTLLLVGGSALTIGSGLVLAVSNHAYVTIDERIRRLEGGANGSGFGSVPSPTTFPQREASPSRTKAE